MKLFATLLCTLAIAAPLNAQRSAYGDYDSPYGNYDSPYGDYDSPYGDYEDPYGDYDSPYGDYDSPYGDYEDPSAEEQNWLSDLEFPLEEWSLAIKNFYHKGRYLELTVNIEEDLKDAISLLKKNPAFAEKTEALKQELGNVSMRYDNIILKENCARILLVHAPNTGSENSGIIIKEDSFSTPLRLPIPTIQTVKNDTNGNLFIHIAPFSMFAKYTEHMNQKQASELAENYFAMVGEMLDSLLE